MQEIILPIQDNFWKMIVVGDKQAEFKKIGLVEENNPKFIYSINYEKVLITFVNLECKKLGTIEAECWKTDKDYLIGEIDTYVDFYRNQIEQIKLLDEELKDESEFYFFELKTDTLVVNNDPMTLQELKDKIENLKKQTDIELNAHIVGDKDNYFLNGEKSAYHQVLTILTKEIEKC